MHQSGVKGFGRKVGRCYHTCLIGIDGIDAIVQNLRNDLIMADPQTDEGKDAQLRIQQLVFLQYYLLFGAQEPVEIFHKSRIKT